jgi:hypothetical protein
VPSRIAVLQLASFPFLCACSPADEHWEFVSVGSFHACGIHSVPGPLDCWGHKGYLLDSTPAGDFSAVSVGDYQACGIRDGYGLCWPPADGPLSEEPDVVVVEAGSYRRPYWALRAGGQLKELGVESGAVPASSGRAPDGPFIDLAADRSASAFCALREDFSLACWTGIANTADWTVEHNSTHPPLDENLRPPRFTRIWGGWWSMCGLRRDGSLLCWGYSAPSTVPGGEIVDVSVGGGNVCAVRADGSIECTGEDRHGVISDVPEGRFSSVSVGFGYACAIERDSAALVCWGTGEGCIAELPRRICE